MANLYSVRNLRKVFNDGTLALDDVSFELREGELLVLSGPNGSGKTVLIKLLVNLHEGSGGTILYKDKPLSRWKDGIHREVGLVFQDSDAQLVGETVEEDTRFGPENLGSKGAELEERVTRALAEVGILHKRESRPAALSGGERRRLAIAGVLAMGVRTIIMDEPYANLDWEGVRLVNESILKLHKQGYTFLIVTHELEKIAGAAGRLGIMHKGRLKALGSPHEILDDNPERFGVRDPRAACASIGDCLW